MASEEDALAAAVRAELAVQAAQHGLSNFRSPDEDAEQLPAEVREELEQEVTASKEELVMFAGLRPGGDYDGIGGERAAPAVDTAAASSSSLAAAEEEAEREANRRDPLRRAHLEDFDEPSQLEDLGLELLKEELEIRGMKCGGTLADRAARLWLARGVAMEELPTTLPKNAMAKKGGQVKKRKREAEEAKAPGAGKPTRRATAGPLMPGQHRRKGQKSLPPKPY